MIRTFVGAVAAVLASLAGLWLMIAPFALGTQPESADWSNPTITEFSTGLGVAVIGLAGAAAFAAAIYENLVTRGLVTVRQRAPEPAPAPTGASSAELATMLAPLVEALREDLTTTNGHRR
ncbi:hypothetical protein GCM10010412_070550 [Nonomuraea recticatena]|uniref:Uncharacterized protein n=1 Tax=Nonomuraea recticatena TaxID=46178 RepID=A0ABN3ST88_9ACTN